MKSITFFFLFLAGLGLSLYGQTEYKSKIKSATLYAYNAQLIREATIQLKPGQQTLIFDGISTAVVVNSIRVTSNTKNVLIRQNSFKTKFIETESNKQEAEMLFAQLDALKRDLEIIDAEKAGILKEREFLNQNSSINGSRGLNLSLAQFQQMGTYFKTQMQKTQSQLYDLEVKRNKKIEDINAITAKLKMVTSVTTKTVGLIEVTIDARKATTATFTLDYLVTNAGWIPEYEMRVDEIGKPVELELKAKLYQETQVDWENVALSFSTGDPQRGSQAPVLTPWYITQPVAQPAVYNNKKHVQTTSGYTGRFTGLVKDSETGEGIIAAVIAFIGPDGKVMKTILTDYDGSYSYLSNDPITRIQYSAFGFESQERNAGGGRVVVQLKATSQKLDEVVIIADQALIETGKTSNMISSESIQMMPSRSVQYIDGVKVRGNVAVESDYERKKREEYERIQRNASQVRKAIAQRFIATVPYSVPSTGEEVSVSLQQLNLAVSYRYFAAPKADADAFLEAQLFRWDTLGLISGEMKIFLEGNYVGNSSLNASNLADTLNLSLGRDPNVVVQRTEINGEMDKSFFGGKITQQKAYKLEARNNKAVPITLYLQDQFPLSPNENIEIKQLESSGGNVDKESGIVTWRIDLKPGQQILKVLNFEVTYPKNSLVYF